MIKIGKYKIDVPRFLMCMSFVWLIASLILATAQLVALGEW